MKKTVILCILAALAAAAVLTGCEKNSGTAETTAPQQAAVSPVKETPPAEEADTYSVFLDSFSEAKKLDLIKYLRENLGLNLKDAKQLTEALPAEVFKDIPMEDALAREEELKNFNAEVRIVGADGEDISSASVNPPDPDKTYDIYLETTDDSRKTSLIKIIREVCGLNLADAKRLAESAPCEFITGVSGSEAAEICSQLDSVGARYSLKEK